MLKQFFNKSKTEDAGDDINKEVRSLKPEDESSASTDPANLTPEEKQKRFEWFLTYRKRLTRLCLIQCLYAYEMYENSDKDAGSTAYMEPTRQNIAMTFRSIIFLYKTQFFKGKYGSTKKNQKIEEDTVKKYFTYILNHKLEMDEYIKKYLKAKWTVYRLSPVVRAILRCGVYELLYILKTDKKIIVSEYVNLTRSFFDGPEVGFVNAILDNIAKELRE
jgi:transcription antitermination factor NusB